MATATPDLNVIGHRECLRERLLSDPGELLDHELLEYLLMLAISRIDTKPIAKALLSKFGGIGTLLAADPGSLMRVKGMGGQLGGGDRRRSNSGATDPARRVNRAPCSLKLAGLARLPACDAGAPSDRAVLGATPGWQERAHPRRKDE